MSPSRLLANRRNALKSTGPRTPRGKANSRLNALRHGLLSSQPVLLPGESLSLWKKFAANVLRDLQPIGPMEAFWASRAALLQWQLLRCGSARQALARQHHREAIMLAPQSDWWNFRRTQEKPLPPSPEDYRRELRQHRRFLAIFDRVVAFAATPSPADDHPVNTTDAIPFIKCAAAHLNLDGRLKMFHEQHRFFPGIGTLRQNADPDFYGWNLSHVLSGLEVLAKWHKITFSDLTSSLGPALKSAFNDLRRITRRADRELRHFRTCAAAKDTLESHKFDQYEAALERRLQQTVAQLHALQLQRRSRPVIDVVGIARPVANLDRNVAPIAQIEAQSGAADPQPLANPHSLGFVSSEPPSARTIQ